ncbi:hypothetical protein O2K51_08270 [Apibacter raozihei]|uniref:hypothetical protein n=1 Tax=Apibacter raozihei TaxID=2500547 RepID=UPI000FE2F80E|nr:hypothetical protein [Apibacter raozihei]
MKNIIKSISLKVALFSVFTILLSLAITSCSSSDRNDITDSIPEHEHDEISKVVLQFREKNSPATIYEVTYEVPEGTTVLPVADVNLPAGEYLVETHFYSPHDDHFHDVTDEIFIQDADDHFVFYQKLNTSNVSIVYADDDRIDTLGRKLGFKTVWTIQAGATGQVYLYLMHQPAEKKQDAVSTDELGGEIDLEAHYKINLQ